MSTKIINLFGGPGSGKSTTAAGLFHAMKKKRLDVELVTEYAKEKVYDNSIEVMSDQLYLLAKQNRRLERLRDNVEWVITDSPLLLCTYYGAKYGKHPDIVCPLAHEVFKTYYNINFFVGRTKPFNPKGRLGGEDNAIEADRGIRALLSENLYSVIYIPDNEFIIEDILREIGID